MSFNSIVWLLIGIFLLLFGISSETTIGIVWSKDIMGYCALIAGACCIVQCIMGIRRGPPSP